MITCRIEQNVAVLSLSHKPVNALGSDMRALLMEQLQAALLHESVEAIVIISSLRLFSAGADLQEFSSGALWGDPDLPTLCKFLDDTPVLTIAAINGAAMGGGLELALACDYRIAAKGALLGLPEAVLGVLPGAGGTQRLPRIAGLAVASDMILSGKPKLAEDAIECGLVDCLFDPNQSLGNRALQKSNDRVDSEFEAAAIEYGQKLLAQKSPQRPSRSLQPPAIAELALNEMLEEKLDNYRTSKISRDAQLESAALLKESTSCDFNQSLVLEREAFDRLLASAEASARIHLFFAERESRTVPDVERSMPTRRIDAVGVVGGGTMGFGIAINFLDAGIAITLIEVSEKACQNFSDRVDKHYKRMLEKGRVSINIAEQRRSLLSTSISFSDLKSADLIIEAVFENMSLKKDVFRQIDSVCQENAILASNTSTLDINEIATVVKRPENVVGLHFFSPANIMRLLEIVRCEKTAPDVLATAIKLGSTIGKVPVTVGVGYGFVGNRMLEPYFREASRLMLEGVEANRIDSVLLDFGMAMGIIAVGDLAGIDVGYKIRAGRREELACDPSYQAIQDKLYELGRFGQKTERGCYIYNGRKKTDDPEVVALCQEIAVEQCIQQREISDEEILERCLYPLINEGFKVLEEGLALRSGDCDVIWCTGYGFPVSKGGPMHYAEQLGINKVLDGLLKYQKNLGPYGEMWFKPSTLLAEKARV